jgi:asparagine synthase (glutamine-hydrolysing)
MCGIQVNINLKGVNKHNFEKSLKEIIHRGPNNQASYFSDDGTIALGSTRLSIQDLSDSANMPLEIGNKVIVYNGEIYNFKEIRSELQLIGIEFKTSSDTEVLLRGYNYYGSNIFKKLRGMFALVIFDKTKKKIICARDRSGEKPMYLFKNNSELVICSELTQIFKNTEYKFNIDKSSLCDFFANGYVNNHSTLIKEIKKFKAGYFEEISINKGFNCLNLEKFFEDPKPKISNSKKEEIANKLDNLLDNSVKNQMSSDVPLGVLLSGGIDSSLISYYAQKNSLNKIKTFHVSFNGDSKLNESVYAKKVSEFLGTEHIEIDGNEISYDTLDQLSKSLDHPIGDSSLIPTFLVSKLTKKYVTVALGGDGGDELFGGYTTYQKIIQENTFLKNIPEFIFEIQKRVTANVFPVGYRGRSFLMGLSNDMNKRFNTNRIFDAPSINKLINIDYCNKNKFVNNNNSDFIFNATWNDYNNYLREDILVKVDRMSMANSLELRAPFLDPKIIDFAFNEVSSNLKVNKNELKIIPKFLANKLYENNINFDRKQGFSIPLDKWLSDKWFDQAYDDLIKLPDFINKYFSIELLENLKNGHSNSSRIFTLIIFSKWYNKFKNYIL